MGTNKTKSTKRTVLITGCSGDIGKAIGLKFASEGWEVLCHYSSSRAKAEKTKKEIEKIGSKCELIKADFSSKAQFRSFIKRVGLLDIDCLVNNAGAYTTNKHFSKLTDDDIVSTFRVNTVAPMILASRIFEKMKKKHFGRIVNISSIAAKYGGSSSSMHYGCSKLALEGITKTLAREGADFDILVNTIRPGVIDTNFHKKYPKNMKKRVAMIPVKKMGRPEDIADITFELGSEENRFITNEIVTVAGGE